MQTKERHLETAFPVPIGQTADDRQGMSLRDFFAANVMSGYMANMENVNKQTPLVDLAKVAYLVADAMLGVRTSSADFVLIPRGLAIKALEYMKNHCDEGPALDVNYKSEHLRHDITEFETYARLGE